MCFKKVTDFNNLTIHVLAVCLLFVFYTSIVQASISPPISAIKSKSI